MPTKQRRYPIKNKDIKQILEETQYKLGLNLEELFDVKAGVEVVESDVGLIYIISGKPVLYRMGDRVLPVLLFSEFTATAPKIVVDMGAVPYVCKGATVMAPGIVRVEGDFVAGALVLVTDMKHGKALAVGESLLDADFARQAKKGPVVKVLHYVGDKVWDYIKGLSE
jgi:PUA domain protein